MGSNEWRSFTIGSLCEAIFDGPHATPEKTEDGPIYLGISNLVNGRIDLSNVDRLSEEDFIKWTRRVTPKTGDLVFSYETRLGEAALIPNGLQCCLGRRMGLLRFDTTKVNPQFMLYAYLGPEFQQTIRTRTIHGSTVDRIPLIELPDFPISIPNLPTQRRIAAILSALDDKIELNRQTNATLEAMAQVIFKEWFVDFRFPGATGEMQESELGMIPQGWHVCKLGDIVEVNGGTTPNTKEEKYWNGEFYWATPKDLSNLHSPILLNTERKITSDGVSQISSGILPKGTLLLSSRAPIGYLAITDIPVSINQGFIAINARKTSNLFMLHWLKNNMENVESRANGSTFLEISKSSFREINLTIPTLNTIKTFDSVVSPIFEQMKINEQQSVTLARIRDSLLSKLMSGEIEV
jgi:type I restriction enzyme S subunit